MKRTSAATLATCVAAATGLGLVTAPASQAGTVKCKTGKYLVSTAEGPLNVSKLRAIDLPAKTDGYAPRCLVAEAAAAEIQRLGTETLPRKITLRGARWSAGTWTCTYEGAEAGTDRDATCKRSSRKITMHLSAG